MTTEKNLTKVERENLIKDLAKNKAELMVWFITNNMVEYATNSIMDLANEFYRGLGDDTLVRISRIQKKFDEIETSVLPGRRVA